MPRFLPSRGCICINMLKYRFIRYYLIRVVNRIYSILWSIMVLKWTFWEKPFVVREKPFVVSLPTDTKAFSLVYQEAWRKRPKILRMFWGLFKPFVVREKPFVVRLPTDTKAFSLVYQEARRKRPKILRMFWGLSGRLKKTTDSPLPTTH